MTTDYNNGVCIDPVPTGFGSYTGVSIFNRSAKPVTYAAEMSETVLYKAGDVLLPEAAAANQNLYNTLFVSSDLTDVNTSLNETVLTLGAGESGNIYIAHKPFNTFSSSAVASTGIETATLNIVSESSAGDADALINIEITGQRILDPPDPHKPGRFFAIESYNETNKYALNFNWQLLNGQAFVTGFKLELCSDSGFTNHVKDSPYQIPIQKNSEFSEPDYLSYYNYGTIDFSYKVNELPTDGDLYSKIIAVNGLDENSDPTFCKGFKSNILPFIDDVTYSGLHPSPGDNLGFGTDFLSIEYAVDNNKVNLTDILSENNRDENNNPSYDFTHYTGVVINFIPSNETDNKIISDAKGVAAVTLKKPTDGSFVYSVNNNNKFNLVLNFHNVFVAGYNGRGATAQSAGEDGGAIFDFDNLNYDNKIFDYYINKDKNSVLYAGLGGEQSFKINNNSTTNVTDGKLLNHENLSDLDSVNRELADSQIKIQAAGSDGKLIKESPSSFPNLYLGFPKKDANSSILNSKLLFRFKTDDIVGNAGAKAINWYSHNGGLNFKNASGDDTSLTVEEAYGRKFYELTGGDNQGKAITATNSQEKGPSFGGGNNLKDIRPNYTILVFALARKDLVEGDYDKTIDEMLSKCGAIHKFVGKTRWGYVGETDEPLKEVSDVFWGTPSPLFDPNKPVYNFYREDGVTKSSFAGSCLNAAYFVKEGSFLQRGSDGGQDAAVSERQYYYLSNQQTKDKSKWKTTEVATGREVANYQNYKNLNLAKTPDFESANNSKFILSDGTALEAFELFFVKMHYTIGDPRFGSPDSDVSLVNWYTNDKFYKADFEGATNETFINGKKVFNQTIQHHSGWYTGFSKPGNPVNANFAQEMLIQLNNNDGSTNPDERTRLYLFDYIYGAALTVDERNSDSESIMQYLSSYYAPLILKSSSAKLIARNNGSSNERLAFDLPLSHNYLDLYSI